MEAMRDPKAIMKPMKSQIRAPGMGWGMFCAWGTPQPHKSPLAQPFRLGVPTAVPPSPTPGTCLAQAALAVTVPPHLPVGHRVDPGKTGQEWH